MWFWFYVKINGILNLYTCTHICVYCKISSELQAIAFQCDWNIFSFYFKEIKDIFCLLSTTFFNLYSSNIIW